MEFDFERQAMKGDPVPKGLDVADSCLYVGLKNIYSMYKHRLINRKEAKEEKETLVYNWTKNKSQVDFLSRESLNLNERISKAAYEYRNNPSVETADNLYAAFYNLSKDWRKNEQKLSNNK